jgi:hypothetical protein
VPTIGAGAKIATATTMLWTGGWVCRYQRLPNGSLWSACRSSTCHDDASSPPDMPSACTSNDTAAATTVATTSARPNHVAPGFGTAAR